MSSSSNSSTRTDQITMSQHSTIFTPSNHLQIKLTKNNYLSWKIASIPYINGSKISHHIDDTVTPPQFIASSSSTTILVPNLAYASWFEIDQLLLGCSHVYHFWKSYILSSWPNIYTCSLGNTRETFLFSILSTSHANLLLALYLKQRQPCHLWLFLACQVMCWSCRLHWSANWWSKNYFIYPY